MCLRININHCNLETNKLALLRTSSYPFIWSAEESNVSIPLAFCLLTYNIGFLSHMKMTLLVEKKMLL